MSSRYLVIFGLKIISAGLLFLAQVLPARVMTVNDFGVYAYIISLVTVFSFFVSWGTDKFTLKNVSLSLSGHLPEIGKKLFGTYAIVLINALVLGIALFAFLKYFFREPQQPLVSVLAAVLLLFLSLSRLSSFISKGTGRVIFSEAVFNTTRPLIFIFLLGISYLSGISLELFVVLVMLILAYIISLLITSWQNQRSGLHKLSRDFSQVSAIYKTAFAFFIVSVGSPLMANIDVLQLGSLSSLEDVAIYSIASKVVNLVLLGLVSANLLISPKLPSLYENGELAKMRGLIRSNNLVILGLTVAPISLLLIFPSEILGFVGSEYRNGSDVLRVLSIGQIISVICGPVLLTAVLAGQQAKAARLMLYICALEWLLCQTLIPVFGIMGAAWANVISYAALNIILAFTVFRHVGINVTMLNIFLHK